METCTTCDRPIVSFVDEEGRTDYKHKDGRVKHPVSLPPKEWPPVEEDYPASAWDTSTDYGPKEENMAPKTRVVSPTGDEEYIPIVGDNENLVPQAEEMFEDLEPELGDLEPTALPTDEENETAPVSPPTNPNFGKPKKEDMVTVRGGGLYLTARRRISWMRGEPQPRPDWTIDTYPEEIERGKFISNNKVEGGYARYRANVFDGTGRLIGTGTKTEWSERFMDFAEKAETGAIARALAVCGYGTEAALDLDEGYEDDRVADAPVRDARPINIRPSNVGGLVQGGRSENITGAQVNEIRRLIGTSAMGMTIVPFIENVLQKSVPELGDDPARTMDEFLGDLTFDEAATLIQALNKAVAEAGA